MAGRELEREESSMLRFAVLVLAVLAVGATPAAAEDGSDLWLRYEPVGDRERLEQYRRAVTAVVVENAHANEVHRHTPDLRMEPGSTEQLVESSLEAARDELVARPERAARTGACRWRRAAARRRRGRGHARELGDRAARTSPPRPRLGRRRGLRRSARSAGVTVIAGNTELGALYGTLRLPAPHADGASRSRASTSPTAPQDQEPPPEQLGDARACTRATTRPAPAG